MIGQSLAIGAGICAAFASIFAKLAMASNVVSDLCSASLSAVFVSADYQPMDETKFVEDFCRSASVVMRFLCFFMMFGANAVMWTLFVRSLQLTSSVIATVTNTASNFFFTAISGYVLFGEDLPLMWWIGAAFILSGLLLMHIFAAKDDSTEKRIDDKIDRGQEDVVEKEKLS